MHKPSNPFSGAVAGHAVHPLSRQKLQARRGILWSHRRLAAAVPLSRLTVGVGVAHIKGVRHYS